MSREHNESYVSPRKSEDRDGLVAGSAILAGIIWVAAAANFGGGYALNAANDHRDSDGKFIDGRYYPNKNPGSEPVFKCNPDKNVVRIETVTGLNELGEEFTEKDKRNYGNHQACPDGKLTEADGEVWHSRLNGWGLAGMVKFSQ